MRLHFIAIGGSAMHNLALAMHHEGHKVTGSDDVIYEPSRSRLDQAGILPESEGWFPDKLDRDIDAVILGMHAKADNPELKKAEELEIKIYSYPEFLYEQSRGKTRVVIGGSHGKTSITAMILHVLNYCDIPVDYMVGAQLEGFDRMVHLTDSNDFIVLEGDEYLSSALDRRPKFHLYKPNIALLSGIAWDHINVFPTKEEYDEQFRIFVDSIVPGGSITYNAEDEVVREIVEASENTIRKIPYTTLPYDVSGGKTYIETAEGPVPVEVFGKHNMNNMAGAKWICQHMGVDEADFFEAIQSFKGAARRLEKIHDDGSRVIFKDFAHAPSKVMATTAAVKQLYPEKELTACLELHTYSSLNRDFIREYGQSLDMADIAIVFYSPKALKVKRLEAIDAEDIRKAFKRSDLMVFTDPGDFEAFLFDQDLANSVLLLMSSGNFGGVDLAKFSAAL